MRSMYFDEDGDLAHEFYVEVLTSRGSVMHREPLERLRPQVRHTHRLFFGKYSSHKNSLLILVSWSLGTADFLKNNQCLFIPERLKAHNC